jgi:hypothetical protein
VPDTGRLLALLSVAEPAGVLTDDARQALYEQDDTGESGEVPSCIDARVGRPCRASAEGRRPADRSSGSEASGEPEVADGATLVADQTLSNPMWARVRQGRGTSTLYDVARAMGTARSHLIGQ